MKGGHAAAGREELAPSPDVEVMLVRFGLLETSSDTGVATTAVT